MMHFLSKFIFTRFAAIVAAGVQKIVKSKFHYYGKEKNFKMAPTLTWDKIKNLPMIKVAYYF